jgi:hypothetical protein
MCVLQQVPNPNDTNFKLNIELYSENYEDSTECDQSGVADTRLRVVFQFGQYESRFPLQKKNQHFTESYTNFEKIL